MNESISPDKTVEGGSGVRQRDPEALIDYGDAYRAIVSTAQPLWKERREAGDRLYENKRKLEDIKRDEEKASKSFCTVDQWEIKQEREMTAARQEKINLQNRHAAIREPIEMEIRNMKANIEEIKTQIIFVADQIAVLLFWQRWKKRSLIKQKTLLEEKIAQTESEVQTLFNQLETTNVTQKEEMRPIEERLDKVLDITSEIAETKRLDKRYNDLEHQLDELTNKRQKIVNEVEHRLYKETELGKSEVGPQFEETISAVREAGRTDVLDTLSVVRQTDESKKWEREFEHFIVLADAVIKRYPENSEMLWRRVLDTEQMPLTPLFQSAGVLKVYFPDSNIISGASAIKNLREILLKRAAFVRGLFEKAQVTLIAPEPLEEMGEDVKEFETYGTPHTDPTFRKVPEIRDMTFRHYDEIDKKFVVGLTKIGIKSPYDNEKYVGSQPAYVWTSAYPQSWWDKQLEVDAKKPM